MVLVVVSVVVAVAVTFVIAASFDYHLRYC